MQCKILDLFFPPEILQAIIRDNKLCKLQADFIMVHNSWTESGRGAFPVVIHLTGSIFKHTDWRQ